MPQVHTYLRPSVNYTTVTFLHLLHMKKPHTFYESSALSKTLSNFQEICALLRPVTKLQYHFQHGNLWKVKCQGARNRTGNQGQTVSRDVYTDAGICTSHGRTSKAHGRTTGRPKVPGVPLRGSLHIWLLRVRSGAIHPEGNCSHPPSALQGYDKSGSDQRPGRRWPFPHLEEQARLCSSPTWHRSMTKQAKRWTPLKSSLSKHKVNGSAGCTGSQVRLLLQKLSPHRLLQAPSTPAHSWVSCLSWWRIPKCLSEFFIYSHTNCCGMQPLQVAGKKECEHSLRRTRDLEDSSQVTCLTHQKFSQNHDLYRKLGEGVGGEKQRKWESL